MISFPNSTLASISLFILVWKSRNLSAAAPTSFNSNPNLLASTAPLTKASTLPLTNFNTSPPAVATSFITFANGTPAAFAKLAAAPAVLFATSALILPIPMKFCITAVLSSTDTPRFCSINATCPTISSVTRDVLEKESAIFCAATPAFSAVTPNVAKSLLVLLIVASTTEV